MFLKRIVLKNFKSFYKTTVLDFPNQITAIVGPNGSGKSNIVDAIRWALGEQSFKNLRVEKGDDLIFQNKDSAAGFAEVELVFDNSFKVFPLDFSEISILRRIDKNNENSYFLNHEPCRLKDIIETTSQAKLGLKGFSIINQGSVENILRVSPVERKLMLEENLGLKNLELKKEEAKRKLENSLINLDKLKAQLEEITPHLRFLKRQVKKFTERQKNEEELKSLEIRYFAYLYKELLKEKEPQKVDFSKINEEIKKIEEDILKEEKSLGLLKEEKDTDLEIKIREITNDILNKQNEKFKILEQIKNEEKEEVASLNLDEIENGILNLKAKLESVLLIQEIEEIKKRIKEIVNYLDSFFKKEPKVKTQNQELKNKLDLLEEEIKKQRETLSALQEELNLRSKNFKEKFQIIEEKRQKRESLLLELKQLELDNEKYKLRFEDFKRRLDEEGIDLKQIEEFLKENKEEIEDISLLERKIWRLKKEILDVGATDENILKEYEEVESRYNFLNNQISDLNSAIKDLKNLIFQLDQQLEEKFRFGINEINKDFSRYFRLMFKGGSAKLVIKKKEKQLENGLIEEKEAKEEEKIEGVDIKVDIPKTKIKSLEILSGGEKTLTAISLLFAIVNQSDPPLVVVDEIDAALDEENSRRFSEILRELSKNTQFIIVTHNRLTMTAASVIYGVTLKNNISQLLSIKLEESEKILNEV
jgi:chromosome segregation protein